LRGEENDDIPNSKHDKKIHEPGKKILYDWLRYVRWESCIDKFFSNNILSVVWERDFFILLQVRKLRHREVE